MSGWYTGTSQELAYPSVHLPKEWRKRTGEYFCHIPSAQRARKKTPTELKVFKAAMTQNISVHISLEWAIRPFLVNLEELYSFLFLCLRLYSYGCEEKDYSPGRMKEKINSVRHLESYLCVVQNQLKLWSKNNSFFIARLYAAIPLHKLAVHTPGHWYIRAVLNNREWYITIQVVFKKRTDQTKWFTSTCSLDDI